jgi:hypothetical protein
VNIELAAKDICVCVMQLHCFETKLSNLILKTQPKQLLGSLPLDIALPGKTSHYKDILTFKSKCEMGSNSGKVELNVAQVC